MIIAWKEAGMPKLDSCRADRAEGTTPSASGCVVELGDGGRLSVPLGGTYSGVLVEI